MPSVALVTTDPEVIDEDVDLDLLLAALDAAGIAVTAPRWHDPTVDWASFDLVVMRSPWDYPERPDAFVRWLAAVRRDARVLNCPDLIEWNLDKSYLLDLAARGVPIVPTRLCDDEGTVEDAIEGLGSPEVIVKPNISAGSRHTGRYERDDPEARRLARTILAHGKRVLVQPCLSQVSEHGERALVYFDGRYSHALRKGPILSLGGGFLGGAYTEDVTAVVPDDAELALADAVISAVVATAVARGFADAEPVPLYARIDIAASEGGPVLMEAELFEPSYFLPTAPAAVDAFVAAVQGRLQPPATA